MDKKQAKKERFSISMYKNDWEYCRSKADSIGVSISKYICMLILEEKRAKRKISIRR